MPEHPAVRDLLSGKEFLVRVLRTCAFTFTTIHYTWWFFSRAVESIKSQNILTYLRRFWIWNQLFPLPWNCGDPKGDRGFHQELLWRLLLAEDVRLEGCSQQLSEGPGNIKETHYQIDLQLCCASFEIFEDVLLMSTYYTLRSGICFN